VFKLHGRNIIQSNNKFLPIDAGFVRKNVIGTNFFKQMIESVTYMSPAKNLGKAGGVKKFHEILQQICEVKICRVGQKIGQNFLIFGPKFFFRGV
jgi:hypothetical protein